MVILNPSIELRSDCYSRKHMQCFLLLLPRGTWKSCEEIIRTAVKRLCQNHTAEISLLYIYPVMLPWLFVLQYLVGWLLHHCLHFDVHSESEQHIAHLENRDTVFRDATSASLVLTLLLITSTSLSGWLTLVQTDVSLQLLVGLMFYTLYRHCWYPESESWRLFFSSPDFTSYDTIRVTLEIEVNTISHY